VPRRRPESTSASTSEAPRDEAPASDPSTSEHDPAGGRTFRRAALAAIASLVVVLGVGFLCLPMQIGNWWYVYPREATAVLAVGTALLPDLPRSRWHALALGAVLGAAGLFFARVPAMHYAQFEDATADFRAITAKLP